MCPLSYLSEKSQDLKYKWTEYKYAPLSRGVQNGRCSQRLGGYYYTTDRILGFSNLYKDNRSFMLHGGGENDGILFSRCSGPNS